MLRYEEDDVYREDWGNAEDGIGSGSLGEDGEDDEEDGDADESEDVEDEGNDAAEEDAVDEETEEFVRGKLIWVQAKEVGKGRGAGTGDEDDEEEEWDKFQPGDELDDEPGDE